MNAALSFVQFLSILRDWNTHASDVAQIFGRLYITIRENRLFHSINIASH